LCQPRQPQRAQQQAKITQGGRLLAHALQQVLQTLLELGRQRAGTSNRPRRRRGPAPDQFADSEVLTVLLEQEKAIPPRMDVCRRNRALRLSGVFHHLMMIGQYEERFGPGNILLRAVRDQEELPGPQFGLIL
jgi:hypothetical protein